MNLASKITKIHYDKNAKGILFRVLEICSLFYGFGSRLKNYLYDSNIIKPKSVSAYVISVGNVTTGGVGKTPVVSKIAKYFISKGEKTAIISRGYGGALSNKQINVISDGQKIFYNARLAGDEPYWLAQNTIGAIVITSKNRADAAKFAIEKYGVTKIVLDDGFQHRKLKRDLDIVLVDSEKLYGNENLLPAGPLREGKEAFKRIDRMVIVSKNTNHEKAEKLAKITAKKIKIPTILCYTEPDYVYNIKTGEILPDNSEAAAISAIGQPEQFYKFLGNYRITKTITFDDHHMYEESELPASTIITTEKDAVKMKDFNRDDIYALKLRTRIDVEKILSASGN